MRDGEPQIYTALATLRNGHAQLQWNRIQMFLVFNTIAIPLTLGSAQPEVVKLVLSGTGFLLHMALYVAAHRGDLWLRYWEKKMKQLEAVSIRDVAGTRVFVFNDPEFDLIRTTRINTRRTFRPIAIVFLVFWFLQSISHLIEWIQTP